MNDYITLLGAEDVSRAASSISTSAGEMRQAAGYIDESLTRFIRQFEELVERMEAAAARGSGSGQEEVR